MEKGWTAVLKEEFYKPYMIALKAFLEKEDYYPPKELIFNAFCQTPFSDVKVVIMGQDPYHGEGQAEGLSFSVREGVKIPPSLHNIFQELADDLHLPISNSGSLLKWAKQGVLLLNAILTVRKNEPLSHHGKGWEIFTDRVVEILIERRDPIVFMLWGRAAKEKVLRVKNSHHLLLEAAHPSPYSARSGFFGCRHFSKANEFLKKNGKAPIDWSLTNCSPEINVS